MMRKIVTMGLAFGLALAPAALSAQGGGVAGRRAVPGRLPALNPAEQVLARRAELGLTASQVTRLEQIRDRLKAQNEPLQEQLAAARPQFGRGMRGAAMLRHRAGAQLSVERRAELRDTARARLQARREELSKLSPEQRAQLRDSVRTRPHARRPGLNILTPEQRTQLRDTARVMVERRRQELQNMTTEQRAELRRQQRERGSQLRAQAEQLRPVAKQLHQNLAASRKEVESVLTSEQLAKLQSMRGRRGGAAPR